MEQQQSRYVFDPPEVVAIPVIDPAASDLSSPKQTSQKLLFPVRRVYCVGSNYADHVREMGGDPSRDPPFFFTKPRDAVVYAPSSPDGNSDNIAKISYPLATEDLHHEVELVVAIGKAGTNIDRSDAMRHVFGYATGIDLTRRDLQRKAKETRRPWDSSKAFDDSAPIGPILRISHENNKDDSGSFLSGDNKIWLNVNGQPRQSGTLNQMVWSVPEIVSLLSRQFQLAPGDLIFSGTPSGIGSIAKGDMIEAGIDGLNSVAFRVE